MTTLFRRIGALVCLAAALSVVLIGVQALMAYTGGINLMAQGPSAALFVVAAFALFILTMLAFGILLGRRHRARGLMWAAFGLAGAPIPLAAFAIAMGGDDAGDPVFRVLLFLLLGGYLLYAAGLLLFGRRLAARGDLPRGVRTAGLLFSGGGGFYVAHVAAAILATLGESAAFPLLALILMVAGGGLVALAEAAIGIEMWRGPRPAKAGPAAAAAAVAVAKPNPLASRSAGDGRSPA